MSVLLTSASKYLNYLHILILSSTYGAVDAPIKVISVLVLDKRTLNNFADPAFGSTHNCAGAVIIVYTEFHI